VSDLLRVLSLAALVAANAFFVIGEFAVVTARRVVARQGAPRRIAVLVWALRLPLE
jgi:CBS domain containing-hemolysin-like protein